MTRQRDTRESNATPRMAMTMRFLALLVMILLVSTGRASAQSRTLWDFVGSGTAVHTANGTSVTSILGTPFVGSSSGGRMALRSGFGSYILGMGSLTGATGPVQGVPAEYFLSQNYPNPFNPSTTIEYGLPSTSIVRLTVFDVLGRTVATLYDGEQAAGLQRLTWIASVSTGLYFYRIDATSVQNPEHRLVRVMKMVLVK